MGPFLGFVFHTIYLNTLPDYGSLPNFFPEKLLNSEEKIDVICPSYTIDSEANGAE